MENVVIVGALRTPTGKLLGELSSFQAPKLCSIVIKELVKSTGLKPSLVDEVILGNVIAAGIGQNPARQAALLAGLPNSVSAFTVNEVCGSGLKAVMLGAQAIKAGDAEVVLAGGMESMSNAPFLLKGLRGGKRMGNTELLDSMIHDGLWDSFYGVHMGTLCEHTAKKFGITREEQDNFALQSHKKAMTATKKGMFKEEIVPVTKKAGKKLIIVKEDESIRWETSIKKLAELKPAFKEGGTITAGNAPGINDGASALLLMSGKRAEKLNIKPLVKVVDSTSEHIDPKWFPIAPVKAIKTLLKKTGKNIDDFDLIEINEAFAAQILVVIKELELVQSKVNVNGGAIALGHPVGSSGARILVTLIHALRKKRKKMGLAALCLGGGGAMSIAVEAVY
jgi:acetyl-CoA C-acetyltransferase